MINPFKVIGILNKSDTVKSGWSIAYFEGLQVIISNNTIFQSLKIDLRKQWSPWLNAALYVYRYCILW